ncbi:hypothetical protein Taro_025164 [Colocasia esculenta]|uniref:C2H2-type domain-containing protein n=1 Tax=Colocasia esculenta TaxID=4460 RepID=A0A843V8R5_COLES|nr:hypothetical protein [Colocasia esculenta]
MSAMEFWGIEVKPGEIIKCEPGDDHYLHLSQASLGEVKKDKGNENIVISLKFNNQKLVIGTLSADKCPQISYDLNLCYPTTGRMAVSSLLATKPLQGMKNILSDNNDLESEDEDIPVKEENGKAKSKGELAKPNINVPKADSAAKPSVKTEEPKKAEDEDDEDDDSADNEDDSEEDEDDNEEMVEGEDDSDDKDGDEDESSEEETPKQVDGKKRPLGSASKTPAPEKKAKLVTPVGSQKTGGGADGKIGGHTATPHPAKHAGKTPATNDKFKQQTPKFAGSALCKSCNRTFRDETALKAHTKAKHLGK